MLPENQKHRLAGQIYDRFARGGARFSVQQVKQNLQLALVSWRGNSSYQALIDDVFREAEQRAIGDTDSVLILKGDYRIGRRHATREDFQEHLELIDEHRAAVNAAGDREHRVYDLLAPYWDEGMTMAEAVERYREANPDAELDVA